MASVRSTVRRQLKPLTRTLPRAWRSRDRSESESTCATRPGPAIGIVGLDEDRGVGGHFPEHRNVAANDRVTVRWT